MKSFKGFQVDKYRHIYELLKLKDATLAYKRKAATSSCKRRIHLHPFHELLVCLPVYWSKTRISSFESCGRSWSEVSGDNRKFDSEFIVSSSDNRFGIDIH
jgi:hypothetical protein